MRTAAATWAGLGLLATAALAAVATLTSSVVLYRDYRPPTPGVDPQVLGGNIASTANWLEREHAAGVALLVLSALAVVACLATLVLVRRWAWGVALAASLVAVGGAALSLATSAAVKWDHLALWAVTVGTDMKGYEAATRTPMVRFVIVDGREVAPEDYRLALLAHMAGPVIAVLALLTALVAVAIWGRPRQAVWRRTKVASSSTASTASGNAG